MNYVFDIDGTICSDSQGNYLNAQPFGERILVVNKLYEEGNQIILYTARGMGSSGNDRVSAIQKWESFTVSQLKLWGVKYHQLFLGKPAGDIYIDDKAFRDTDFFKRTKNS